MQERNSSGPASGRLRPSGGYRRLRSFRLAGIIYDATVDFCARFLDRRSRTVDQMVQAAHSGRQNIAEGSRAAATSASTELRLTSVARASLDELLLDYEDFLRQRRQPQWHRDSPEAQAVRSVRFPSDPSDHPSDPTDPSDPSDHPSDPPANPAAVHAPSPSASTHTGFVNANGRYPG